MPAMTVIPEQILIELIDGIKVELYFGKAEDILDNFEKGFQLVYMDPPFCTGKDFYFDVGNRRILAYSDFRDKKKWLEWLKGIAARVREKLCSSGWFYLHVDQRVAHYAKIVLDEVFGEDNFVNEIIWCYETGGVPRVGFPRKHDNIFAYAKSLSCVFFKRQYVKKYLKHRMCRKGVEEYYDPKVKQWYRYKICPDWWDDIDVIRASSKERVGFFTQKPTALLKRIILSSSKKGDIIGDFTMGSGTTAVTSLELGRSFVGVDRSPVSIFVTLKRILKKVSKANIYKFLIFLENKWLVVVNFEINDNCVLLKLKNSEEIVLSI